MGYRSVSGCRIVNVIPGLLFRRASIVERIALSDSAALHLSTAARHALIDSFQHSGERYHAFHVFRLKQTLGGIDGSRDVVRFALDVLELIYGELLNRSWVPRHVPLPDAQPFLHSGSVQKESPPQKRDPRSVQGALSFGVNGRSVKRLLKREAVCWTCPMAARYRPGARQLRSGGTFCIYELYQNGKRSDAKRSAVTGGVVA